MNWGTTYDPSIHDQRGRADDPQLSVRAAGAKPELCPYMVFRYVLKYIYIYINIYIYTHVCMACQFE